MTGCNGEEKEIKSTICNRRKINLNTEEWSCEKMKNTWRGIESCPFCEYRNGVWNVSVIK